MEKSLLSTFLIISLFSTLTFAQSREILNDKSEVKVEGTSSLHDWHCDVESISGSADVSVEGDKVTSVNTLDLTFVVKSLKSGKGSMDKNVYAALKEKSNPNITFKSSKATIDANGVVSAEGQLTIAGATKNVTLTAQSSVNSGVVSFAGKTTFKMTEYSVEPPTAMFGTITTGDEVTIVYNVSI